MNLDQFLYRLHQLDVQWTMTRLGRIRYHCHCPITLLEGSHLNCGFYRESARALDLSDDLTDPIIDAADNLAEADPIIRRKLLESCRLA